MGTGSIFVFNFLSIFLGLAQAVLKKHYYEKDVIYEFVCVCVV